MRAAGSARPTFHSTTEVKIFCRGGFKTRPYSIPRLALILSFKIFYGGGGGFPRAGSPCYRCRRPLPPPPHPRPTPMTRDHRRPACTEQGCRAVGRASAAPPAFWPVMKLSWPQLATPEDEKCGTAAPGCSFPKQARAPALHCQGDLHGISSRPNLCPLAALREKIISPRRQVCRRRVLRAKKWCVKRTLQS